MVLSRCRRVISRLLLHPADDLRLLAGIAEIPLHRLSHLP